MSVWLLGGPPFLANPDFEVGTTAPWVVLGSSVALNVSTADQYAGDYSALVSCASGYYGATSGPRFFADLSQSTEKGCSYFFRCAIKVGSGTLAGGGAAVLRVTGFSVSDVYASRDINVSTTWKTFGLGWTQETVANSMKARIFLPSFINPETDNGGIFFDDLEIYSAVELSAGYDYKFGKVQQRNDMHDRSGALHSYILPGGYRRFNFPGLNINSAGRCAVASFWANGDTCYFIEDDTNPTSMYAVKVMGVQEPFQSFTPPYGLVRYAGDLILETVDVE